MFSLLFPLLDSLILCTLTRTSFEHKFIGCPIYIEHDKYKRNALIFNVCFTFDEKTNTTHYCPVVKKLADYMTQLEVSNEIVLKYFKIVIIVEVLYISTSLFNFKSEKLSKELSSSIRGPCHLWYVFEFGCKKLHWWIVSWAHWKLFEIKKFNTPFCFNLYINLSVCLQFFLME